MSKMPKTIYGNRAKSVCAVCHLKKHRGGLTVKQLKKHRCLSKQCNFLEKIDHQYWVEREVIKQRKKRDIHEL